MRLHHLTVSAFGPFADTVEIPLDSVAANGLFLIRGATGAGKTSLLDAVSFALFSDVPGARSKKGLRSDHAARTCVPEVSLEFTATGRRLRIERSAEFTRPKARGAGETKVPAKATLWESQGDDWQPLSTRHDEIAEIVQDVLGMGMEQFSKVVLLPQGDFAAFLRASPEERRTLLERLFDVSTYAGIEEWFALRRRETAAGLEAHLSAFTGDLGILGEVLAGAPAMGAHPDWPTLSPEEVPAALRDTRAGLEVAAAGMLADLDAARLADTAAEHALARALEVTALRTRAFEANAQVAVLERGRDAQESALMALGRSALAASLHGDLKSLTRADRALAAAHDRVAAGKERVGPLGIDDRSAPGLEAIRDRLDAASPSLEEAAHRAAALTERTQRHDRVVQRLAELEAAAADLAQEVEGAEAAQLTAHLALQDARTAIDRRDSAEAATKNLARLHRLRLDQDHADREWTALSGRLAVARSNAQDLRDDYQDRRQARLDGMAAELAAALTSGGACPVCGSLEHPTPATTSAPVTAEEVELAEAAWQGATVEVVRLDRAIASLEAASRQRAHELAGEARGSDDLAGTLATAMAELATLQRLAERRPALEADANSADGRVAALRTRSTAVAVELTGTDGSRATLEEELAMERASLAEALACHRSTCPCATPGPTAGESLPVDGQRRRHGQIRQAVGELAGAVEELSRAESEHDAVVAEAARALADAGFETAEAALAALLPGAEVALLREQTTAYEQSWIAAHAVLDDPAVTAALAAPEPDLAALEHGRGQARARLLASTEAETMVRRTLEGLDRVRASLDARCAQIGAATHEYAVLRELAEAVSGTGASNALRMRLSAFVLAARLEKVAALANERLAAMGDGRYRLMHSDSLAARGARSGLGLEVLDLWTGQARDTSSLSGGESFMASLALALGLADAIREEAGGFDLQTLFVDEGFGTLDDESLEQVMEVLDGLREGGRAVGVVSHVAELRARISSQIVVSKSERGSTVRLSGTGESAPAA